MNKMSSNNKPVMEIDESTTYGECRCCLAKGEHRDVTKEYYYNNIKEVYKDIFLECFNLVLSPHNRISSLICKNCVHRLRDASSFRMMVAATEDQLLKAVVFKSDPDNDTEFVDVTDNFTTEVKIECETEDDIDIEPEQPEAAEPMDIFQDDDWTDDSGSERELMIDEGQDDDDESVEYETDFDDCESLYSNITLSSDDEPIEVIDGESKLLERFPTAQPLPKRSELAKICPEYDEQLKKLGDKIVKTESLKWFFKTTEFKEKMMSDKQALAANATTIFEYSNATAFRTKMRNGYPCYYCKEVYKHEKLRKHQQKHPKSSIHKLFHKYNADEFVVYADVTDLKCTICKKNVKNLNVLKAHLTEKHARKIYPAVDRVIPFKLRDSNFECQICHTLFETFNAVERHMNTHFGNFICKVCGSGFITKHRLAVHTYTQHKDEKTVCKVCKKSFPTKMKYRMHFDGVHKNLKKFKCPKCSERFIDYYTRQKHLVDVHDETPLLYKCNICNKAFKRRFALSSHVKRCHMAERNVKCPKCSYKCFTNSELKDHMVKHGTKEIFRCSICNSIFNRKRSLAMHMKQHKEIK